MGSRGRGSGIKVVGVKGGGSGIKGQGCMEIKGWSGGGQGVVESRGMGWWGSREW